MPRDRRRPRIVLVVGTPRSGTTLALRCLTELPGVVAIPETHYFSMCSLSHNRPPRSRAAAEQRLQEYKQNSIAQGLRIRPGAVVGRVPTHEFGPVAVFRALVEDLASQHGGVNSDPSVILEKTPAHLHYARTALRLDQELTAIVVQRGLRDTVLSMWSAPFTDYSVHRYIGRWRNDRRVAAKLRSTYPDRVYTVTYDSLVTAYVEVRERLRSHLQLGPGLKAPDVPVLDWETWKDRALLEPGDGSSRSRPLADREAKFLEWASSRWDRQDDAPHVRLRLGAQVAGAARVVVALVRERVLWESRAMRVAGWWWNAA